MDIKALVAKPVHVNPLAVLDVRITLQFVKEKRTNRTYVLGLHHFLKPEQINPFVENMKSTLGTSSLIRKLDDGSVCYGFQGNHMAAIKKTLVDDFHIDPKKIKDVV